MAAGRLTIDCERDGLTHTVTVVGELDIATAAGLEVELMAVEATDAKQIVLDLSGLTFMDSGAVHLIARADARCTAAAKRLRLLRGPPHSQRVFALVGADSDGPVHASATAAPVPACNPSLVPTSDRM